MMENISLENLKKYLIEDTGTNDLLILLFSLLKEHFKMILVSKYISDTLGGEENKFQCRKTLSNVFKPNKRRKI